MKRILILTFVLAFILIGCTPATPTTTTKPVETETQEGIAETPPATQPQTEPEKTDPPETDSPETAGERRRITMGAILIDTTNQFFVDMIEGGNVAAEDYNVDINWVSSDGNIDNQISQMENFIDQGVDVILINPIDSDALETTIKKSSDAGIPVVAMAGIADAELCWTTVYNDEENTRIIGKIVGHLLDGEGKVGLVYGNQGNLVSDLRQKGFHDGIAMFPDISLVEQPANWDGPTGLTVAQDMMGANPDLKAIHSVSEVVTLAIYQAVLQADKQDEIIVTSYDGNPEGIDAVEDGEFYLTLLTGAKKTGYWNVKVGVQLALGERPTEKILNLDTHFVMTQDMQDKVKEMDIEEDFSMLLPDAARAIGAEYRDELYDPELNK